MIKRILVWFFCLELIFYPLGLAQEGMGVTLPEEEIQTVSESIAPSEEEAEPELLPGNVTVNFKGADIRAVLNYLSDVGGVDIVPAPDVTGPVTLKLTNKPWETALDIIVRNYGFAYEREANIIRVITVDSLKMEELSSEVVKLNYAKAEEILDTTKDMLSDRGRVKADSRTNTLVITDIPTNIYKVKQIVTKLDRKTPQIMIEAKIIETELGKNERMGIDWNIKIAASGSKRPVTMPFTNWGSVNFLGHEFRNWLPIGQTGTAATTVGSGGATTQSDIAEFPTSPEGPVAFPFVEADEFTFGTLDFSQFSLVLEYLKQRSNTEIISNPRVTTLNNKEAKILVGRVYNFPTFAQVEETGKWIISGYEAKDLGIKLLVTPNVNENNEIVVNLKPEISNFLGLEKISDELFAPLWSTREADTEVMVRDGDTIFIGGLIKENNIERDNRIPIIGDLFGDLPLFGHLVKYKSVSKEKTELIFFITVNIVKDRLKLAELEAASSQIYVPMDEMPGTALVEEKKAMKEKKHKPWLDFRKKE